MTHLCFHACIIYVSKYFGSLSKVRLLETIVKRGRLYLPGNVDNIIDTLKLIVKGWLDLLHRSGNPTSCFVTGNLYTGNYATHDNSGMCHLMSRRHLPEWKAENEQAPGGYLLVERWVRGCAAQIGCFFGLSGFAMAPFLFENWFRYRSRFCKMHNFRWICPLVYL